MNSFVLLLIAASSLVLTNGLTNLADCPPGYYCGLGRSVTPQACPPGSFSLQGASRCTTCTPGYYQIASGKSYCDQCPPGSYAYKSLVQRLSMEKSFVHCSFRLVLSRFNPITWTMSSGHGELRPKSNFLHTLCIWILYTERRFIQLHNMSTRTFLQQFGVQPRAVPRRSVDHANHLTRW